jgi:hypothetical protein
MNPMFAMLGGSSSAKKNSRSTGSSGCNPSFGDLMTLSAMTGQNEIAAHANHVAMGDVLFGDSPFAKGNFNSMCNMALMQEFMQPHCRPQQQTSSAAVAKNSGKPSEDELKKYANACAKKSFDRFYEKLPNEIKQAIGAPTKFGDEEFMKFYEQIGMPKVAAELRKTYNHPTHYMYIHVFNDETTIYGKLLVVTMQSIIMKVLDNLQAQDEKFAADIKNYRESTPNNEYNYKGHELVDISALVFY